MGNALMGWKLAEELCVALGIDPANRPIKKITIEAQCGEPAFAIVTFIDTKASGAICTVLERYELQKKATK